MPTTLLQYSADTNTMQAMRALKICGISLWPFYRCSTRSILLGYQICIDSLA